MQPLSEISSSILSKLSLNKRNGLKEENRNRAFQFLISLIVVGVVGIFVYGARYYRNDSGINSHALVDIISIFSLTLLISGASFAIGVLIGFLFGIPKVDNSELTTDVSQPRHFDNDNLVQISDWFTKVLVGVSLTQISQIPGVLQGIGEYLGEPMGGDTFAQVFSVLMTVYFLVCGFLTSYLWTRLYFKTQLAQAHNSYSDAYNKLFEEGLTNTVRLDDDPQKGQWGGLSESNGRKLTATIKESRFASGYFDIDLFVESTLRSHPLKERVKFHLHPTFRNSTPEVTPENGRAVLSLIAWGAFTVGAELEDGTVLELDLSELTNAPEVFKSR